MMMMSPLPGGRRGPQLPDPLVGDQLAVGEREGGEGGAVRGQRGDRRVWRQGEIISVVRLYQFYLRLLLETQLEVIRCFERH